MSELHPEQVEADTIARDTHINILIAASRFTSQMDKVCRRYGIGHSHYAPLLAICFSEKSEQGVPTGELNKGILGLLRPVADTTRLVDHLIRQELVERKQDPNDRRRVLVKATPKGRTVVKQLSTDMRNFHRAQWQMLPPTELQQLHDLLQKVLWPEPRETEQQRTEVTQHPTD